MGWPFHYRRLSYFYFDHSVWLLYMLSKKNMEWVGPFIIAANEAITLLVLCITTYALAHNLCKILLLY